jgi:hypothetical protein
MPFFAMTTPRGSARRAGRAVASLNPPTNAAEAAAHNNAAWCSALCAAHGDSGHWTASAWLRRTLAPPYYPNLVTLRRAIDHVALAALLQELPQNGPCAVKDSFARLTLDGHGFRVLFDARWHWRDPATAGRLPAAAALRWRRVDTPATLAAWEAAWWRGTEPEARGLRPRLFPDALLQRPDLLFIAGHDGPQLAAGGVWSRSQAPGAGAVLGLSCCFGAAEGDPSVTAALVREAERWCPGLPQAGYESANAEVQAQACGFTCAGPLRVWLREPAHD